ncbi:3-oxoacyl-ACP synthase [Kriegella sp. EG-1]|nr:3-oxoacyl-ACP synthase [Flavobacteriaceae bacterium EG-1]
MNQNLNIQAYCHIRNGEIVLNGKSIFKQNSEAFKDFIKAAYKYLEIDHSKFFKMDNLSKLAFIAAEVLLKNESEKNIALILSNKASSIDTDRKHQNAIENGFASPAIFVYTLPNICLGEISIRHQLYSENAFFVFDEIKPDILFDYSENLIKEGKAKKSLCGWVDFDNGKYDAFLYIVANSGTFVHSISEITRLY